ncbi:hypothetical protein ACHAXT_012083 [Thalassiosira profunda]
MAPGTSNGNGTPAQKNGTVTLRRPRPNPASPFLARAWSSHSLKVLVLAGATYAIVSMRFGSVRLLQYPREQYHEVEFEPPGARRWNDEPERDLADEGDGAPQHVPDEDEENDLAEENIAEMVEEAGEEEELIPHSNLRGDGDASQQTDSAEHEIPPPKPTQPSPSRRVPWTIAIDADLSVRPLIKSADMNDFEEESMPIKGPKVKEDWYEPNADEFIDGYDWSVCEPMYDWQMESFPNCNNFHEMDVHNMRVINTGGSRIAMEMKQQLNGEEAKFVYKMSKYHKDITMKYAEEQRKDALVMERTSSSQFIPDVYGYCSLGVLMDFMPEGNMHDYIKGARLAGGSTLPPVDRLRLSIHIATSVADLHTIDDTPMPSYFHNDICCHQYLFHNGVFKLNDFNYARPIYINKKTNEQCTRRSFGMAMWKARSLEEHMTHYGDKRAFVPVKPDKIDVWMMGNLIFYMTTDQYTFEKPNLTSKQAGRELLAGRRSPLPEHVAKSNDPSYVALRKALDMCWVQDHRKRPTARSISDYLIGVLKEITGEENPDVTVTLPKRDPKQRNTDSDYEKYND